MRRITRSGTGLEVSARGVKLARRPVDAARVFGATMQTSEQAKRDPRRLRALMERAFLLAKDHRVGSVFIGVAGPEGDLLVPEFIAFLESELRVEDGVFVLTRERAVLLLTDVDVAQAKQVVERVRRSFESRFPTAGDLPVAIRFQPVRIGGRQPTAKTILPKLFTGGAPH